MPRPLLLDLYCCAGGAGTGYHRAGFDVVGVDIDPQPNYPFKFIQADVIAFLRDNALNLYDAIHASPPCQAHVKGMAAANRALGRSYDHGDLVGTTRHVLNEIGLPYVIENVVGAPLRNAVRLCGSSFGLPIQRHRLFESNVPMMGMPCAHHLQTEAKFWTSARKKGEAKLAKVVQVYGNGGDTHLWPEAMGIDWMTTAELAEAIPPVYTKHVGGYLMAAVLERVAA